MSILLIFITASIISLGISTTEDLNLVCYPNGTLEVDNPEPAHYIYGLAEDTNTACYVEFNTDNTRLSVTGCVKDEDILLQLSNRTSASSGLIGGSDVGNYIVILRCNEINASGVQSTIIQQLTSTLITANESSVAITAILSMAIRRGGVTGSPASAVTINEQVTWTLDVPSSYTAKIRQCSAYPGTEIGGNVSQVLIVDGCTQNTDMVLSFSATKTTTVGANTRYYTTFYAFRFISSNTMALACTVDLCVEGGCDMTCSDTRRKREVSVDENDKGFHIDKTGIPSVAFQIMDADYLNSGSRTFYVVNYALLAFILHLTAIVTG